MERLLLWVIRMACYGVALLFAALAGFGLYRRWPWPIGAALFAIAGAFVWYGRRFGGCCPIEVIPRDDGKSDVVIRVPGDKK
ncbi:MAG: hypothetical protein ACT4QC_13900 [Planctomycetaceae bacterium]